MTLPDRLATKASTSIGVGRGGGGGGVVGLRRWQECSHENSF